MIKKWIMVALIAAMLPLRVSAAQGSLTVHTDARQVALYRVGWPEGRGYRLDETFGGGYLTPDDTLSPELAAWLHSRTYDSAICISNGENPEFYNLEEGLYLVWGEDAFPPFLVTIPWDGYHWHLEVNPLGNDVPQTGDSVGLSLLVMSASGAGMLVLGRRRKRY